MVELQCEMPLEPSLSYASDDLTFLTSIPREVSCALLLLFDAGSEKGELDAPTQ